MPPSFLDSDLSFFSTLLLFSIEALRVPSLIILVGHSQILFLTEIGEHIFI